MQVIRYIYFIFLCLYPIFMWILTANLGLLNNTFIVLFTATIHLLCWVGGLAIYWTIRSYSKQSIDNQ